jgi:hypothetical protein
LCTLISLVTGFSINKVSQLKLKIDILFKPEMGTGALDHHYERGKGGFKDKNKI